MQRNSPDELAKVLSKSSAWPTATGPIDVVQTHISHVFLVGDQVFKLRKDVRMPFLDFSTTEARNQDCVREVELNRRLAPSVYLGIAPLIDRAEGVTVGPIAQSVTHSDREHVVVMRRLAPDRDALSLLEQNRLGQVDIEAIAQLLAKFHAGQGLGRPAPWTPADWLERISTPILACFTSLCESGVLPKPRLRDLETNFREQLHAFEPLLEQRRLEGRAIDGHGDLHLDHVWLEPNESRPLLIDCLEFSEDLRKIDPASEVAFLAMDLRYRGRADLAEWFLTSYARETDDYGLFPLANLYSGYRALVRAKVAALAILQETIRETQRVDARTSTEQHFVLAESLLQPSIAKELVVLCGTVGSGKSTVAHYLTQNGRGIAIASDRVRKAMAGIDARTHSEAEPDEGLYTPERTEHVYRALLDRAQSVIDSGRTPILDASFSKRLTRDNVREWAAKRGLRPRLIEVCCDSENARSRLRERARAGADPSDAGPNFLPESEARFEDPVEWPEMDRQVVWTDQQGWEHRI
jgi:aminoglycoside phosphotransferase family enzyme/predicted kinase